MKLFEDFLEQLEEKKSKKDDKEDEETLLNFQTYHKVDRNLLSKKGDELARMWD